MSIAKTRRCIRKFIMQNELQHKGHLCRNKDDPKLKQDMDWYQNELQRIIQENNTTGDLVLSKHCGLVGDPTGIWLIDNKSKMPIMKIKFNMNSVQVQYHNRYITAQVANVQMLRDYNNVVYSFFTFGMEVNQYKIKYEQERYLYPTSLWIRDNKIQVHDKAYMRDGKELFNSIEETIRYERLPRSMKEFEYELVPVAYVPAG